MLNSDSGRQSTVKKDCTIYCATVIYRMYGLSVLIEEKEEFLVCIPIDVCMLKGVWAC